MRATSPPLHALAGRRANARPCLRPRRTFDEKGIAFPVCHGATSEATFVLDAAKVIRQEFMARDPSSIQFNVTALCKMDD